MIMEFPVVFFLVLFSPFLAGSSNGAIFTLQNNCKQTIWPGILSGGGTPLLANGGLLLTPNQKVSIPAPPKWSGRFWPRTGCKFDPSQKQGTCTTGDCGGVLQCGGAGGIPPASLAEFTLGSNPSDLDFYDVSLVDGFNVPVSIIPSGGTGNCSAVKCVVDVNMQCPPELQVKQGPGSATVACKSPCAAFNKAEYCCSGAYNSPQTCKPSKYSMVFKKACPTAYSYAYDDAISTFTCKNAADYLIQFC